MDTPADIASFSCFQDADVRDDKVAMEDRLTVECSAPWLSAPAALLLSASGRNFEIQVHGVLRHVGNPKKAFRM